MNAQLELLKMLHRTSFYYEMPGKHKWEADCLTEAVFFIHPETDTKYWLELNPQTNIIEGSATQNNVSLSCYTEVINLGNHTFSPDMVKFLHAIFSFDFASDAIIVVKNNLITTRHTPRQNPSGKSASEAKLARPNKPSSSSVSVNAPGHRHNSTDSHSHVKPSRISSTSRRSDISSTSFRSKLFRRLLFLKPL